MRTLWNQKTNQMSFISRAIGCTTKSKAVLNCKNNVVLLHYFNVSVYMINPFNNYTHSEMFCEMFTKYDPEPYTVTYFPYTHAHIQYQYINNLNFNHSKSTPTWISNSNSFQWDQLPCKLLLNMSNGGRIYPREKTNMYCQINNGL